MSVTKPDPFTLVNIADLFFKLGHLTVQQTRELSHEFLSEMNTALRFANPMETKIEPMAFSDPKRYASGDVPKSKAGVFGKLLKSFLDNKINIFEFGRLITKFSETCIEREWKEFFKPILEQRLLYPPMFFVGDEWWWKTEVVFPIVRSYSYENLPSRMFIGGGMSHNGVLSLKAGRGEAIFHANGKPLRPVPDQHPYPDFISSLISQDIVYGLDVECEWTSFEIMKINDLYLWDDMLTGDLRISYERRRSHIETLVDEDISFMNEEFLATPETFHKVSRIFFEQGNRSLSIRDADSTKYERRDNWFFGQRGEARIIDIVGHPETGMDHYVLDFHSKTIRAYQGTSLLTFNHRRKIYHQREEIIGKYVDLIWNRVRDDGTPDYAIVDMSKPPYEENEK